MAKSGLPKLSIRYLVEAEKPPQICTVEESRRLLDFNSDSVVIVQKEIVHSHEEMKNLLRKNKDKSADPVEVLVMPYLIEGG